jgi:hypothetical protein
MAVEVVALDPFPYLSTYEKYISSIQYKSICENIQSIDCESDGGSDYGGRESSRNDGTRESASTFCWRKVYIDKEEKMAHESREEVKDERTGKVEKMRDACQACWHADYIDTCT